MSTLTTPAPDTTAAPLRIGPHTVAPPVVLAPMAGITNAPFRTLCREFSAGKGLFVSEMITTRALVERNEKTMQLIRFDATETPRSIQLYGVDPVTVGKAVRMIAEEDLADHIDLNFGCPVPKVTRKGGGSALPYKRNLLRAIVREAVTGAGDLPVTMKMRKGIDDDHLTCLDAGRIAVEEGVSAIALHGRTTAQHYGGTADWDAIARLKEHVPEIPVLGNGDIWSAEDALRMVRETGCDGVVVGRGCLGRPWLFADLVAAFEGRTDAFVRPTLREVADVMVRHATLLGSGSGTRRGASSTSASTSPGTSRASPSAPRCASGSRSPPPSRRCAPGWTSWTSTSPGRPVPTVPAAGRPATTGWSCRTAG
ncbi:tRNA-dihydrouridine synthase OS=Streptomyces tendae OX=1932 GN=dusB PE=3 SV=1 [Streptomyces tendae]